MCIRDRASPLVCILNGKDVCDGIRLAVDYRYVNKFTVDDAYPLPDIQSIYLPECVQKAQWYLSQIVNKAIGNSKFKNLTAFVCDMGLFEFCRVPFGMKNSGSCFVRAITKILRPLSNVAKSFVDDIAVHSGGWMSHMVDLRKFLETIKQSGLTLNPVSYTHLTLPTILRV